MTTITKISKHGPKLTYDVNLFSNDLIKTIEEQALELLNEETEDCEE